MLLRTSSMSLWNSRRTAQPEQIILHQKMLKSKSCSEISVLYLFGTYTKKKKPPPPLAKCMSVHGLEKRRGDVVTRSNERHRLFSKELFMMSGGGGGGGLRKIGCGGNGGDENEHENEDDSEDWGGDSLTDLYYKRMIQADPGNPLLLSNYARYLKEVRFDFLKAEEYCERAVMARPDDGNILSLYAELKWEIYKDPILAEHYFNLSVKASPEDWGCRASPPLMEAPSSPKQYVTQKRIA